MPDEFRRTTSSLLRHILGAASKLQINESTLPGNG